eukprot:superscaffoldBa00002823_g15385
MCTFYQGTIESILSSCMAVWGGSCTDQNRKTLQRIVNTAGRIIGAPLPFLQDIYNTHLTRKATTIVRDASHPAHSLRRRLLSSCVIDRQKEEGPAKDGEDWGTNTGGRFGGIAQRGIPSEELMTP